MADRGTVAKAAAAIAITLAIPAEGLRQHVFRDPAGVLTACYGSTHDLDPHKTYTLAECRARLDTDMQAAVATVERCAPGLPDHALAAFGDAVYNLGPKIVCGQQSTAARYLKQGKLTAACNELPKWDKTRVAGVMIRLPGLTKRRERERRVCLGETLGDDT